MANMLCTVISPEKILFQEQVHGLVCPMTNGEMGILPGHAPFLGKLGIGLVQLRSETKDLVFAIDSGFVEVKNNEVSLLVNRAKQKEDIAPKETLQEKLQILKDQNLGDAEVLREIAWIKAQKKLIN